MNKALRATCNNGHEFTNIIKVVAMTILTSYANERLAEDNKNEYRNLSAMDAIDRRRALRK